MGFFKRAFTKLATEDKADGRPILRPEDTTIDLGRVEDFESLLEAVREIAPVDSILALEGTPSPDVRQFLQGVAVEPQVRITRGTVWPRQEFFHFSASRQNIDHLLELVQHHATPEIGYHLILYRDREALLWVHDMGDGWAYAGSSLSTAQREVIQGKLKQHR